MRRAAMLGAIVAPCFAVAAGAQVMGWRGDGSGKYPDAGPPLEWGRHAKTITDLSAFARKPKEDALPAKEDAIVDGEIRRWLVLGPVPIADGKKADEALPNAQDFAPDANGRLGELVWQPVTIETSGMDLCALFGKDPKDKGYAAYACAYLYSPSTRSVGMNHMFSGQGTDRVWLNGDAIYTTGKGSVDIAPCVRLTLNLKKGWNRLVILVARTQSGRKTCWFTASLYGQHDAEYEARGIAWSTLTPAIGTSAPVIAKDRLFFTCEGGCVVCVNKADGKILWAHTVTWYDCATPEERAAHADVFRELAPVAEKLKALDAAAPHSPPAYEEERTKIDRLIANRMGDVDEERFCNPANWGCAAGYSVCTPVTDGTLVWTLFGNGVLACFDLDGNRQWIRLLKHTRVEHGYTTSPLFVEGKIVVYFADFTVMDAKTGAVLVERPYFTYKGGRFDYYSHFLGTGCVLQAGDEKVVYYLNGEFVRLSDGKTLDIDLRKLASLRPQNWKEDAANRIATPVAEGGIAYKITQRQGGAVAFRLPPLDGDKVDPAILCEAPFSTLEIPYFYDAVHCSSPLYHEGLLYCVNDFGWLTVADMAKGEVVYQRLLDTEVFMPYNQAGVLKGGVQSSPTLAGKHIYIWGNQGTCVVFKPGRTFKQVAKNRVEKYIPGWQAHQEATMTNPVFEGDRMYYRAEYTIYCIGPK